MTETPKPPWQCSGSPAKPHTELENWGDKCMYPGCSMVRGADDRATPPDRPPNGGGNRSKLPVVAAYAALALALLGGGSYALYRKINNPGSANSCPSGQQIKNGICVAVTLVAPSTLATFNPDWLSNGDRVLLKGKGNQDRDLGVEAFNKGNYKDAVTFFEKAVLGNRNDPEVQIYLNNAKARLAGSPLVLAAVVPIDNKQASAEEMLRGIADAQTRYNEAGGAGGRLVELVIANDGNESNRASSIAHQLANDPSILGVVGHNSSSATQAGLTEYEQVGLAVVSPTSTSTSLSGSVFFRTVPSDEASAKKLAEYAKNKLGINKIAVFYNSQSNYSTSLQKAFDTHFRPSGGKLVGLFDLSDPNLDPKKEIPALQNQVQAIALFPDTATTSVAVALARVNADFPGQKLQILGGDALYSSDTLVAGGEAIEGLIVPVPWFANAQGYAQEAQKRWLGRVNWRTATSFDATQALLSALSGNPTRAALLQNLKSTNLSPTETSGEPLQFSAKGERAVEPVLVQVTKGVSDRPQQSDYGFQLIQP
jgi:branched-chain amino acid transport system substrate-binding protein